MKKERLLPRLFHRRLALLAGMAVFVSLALGARLAQLTLLNGAESRASAEARLHQRTYLATIRGAIRDRHGEPLAFDRASYDIAVDYEVISGVWVVKEAVRAARRKHGNRWREMGPTERFDALEAERAVFDHRVEQLWDVISLRGGIDRADLDRRIDAIKSHVEGMATAVWTSQQTEAYIKYGTPEPGEKDLFDRRPIREHAVPHVVLKNVPEEIAFDFARLQDDLPGLRVLGSTQRDYPWSSATVTLDRSTLPPPLRRDEPITIEVRGVADHIIGAMRNGVWASDIDRRPFQGRPTADRPMDLGGYGKRFDDSVGVRGLEAALEDVLRGYRGISDRHLNTGGTDRVEPIAGQDVELTLDIQLQAKIQAILSPEFGLTRVQQFHTGWDSETGTPKATQLPLGQPLNAAAVVLDVDTGHILALVSMPTRADGETWSPERRALANPFVNRAAESPYPPGSIIKPLLLTAAVTAGAHNLGDRIVCTGHYFPHLKEMARCWIYREKYGFTTHTAQLGRALDARDALTVSCNIYFYTLADKLGGMQLVDWYRRFGLGGLLNVGLLYDVEGENEKRERRTISIGENRGVLPTRRELLADGGLQFTEIIMGIGQGPIAWTPLQAANAYAIVARGGVVRDATILKHDPRGSRPRREKDLRLDPRAVNETLDGLRQSIMDRRGTGHAIRFEGGTSEPIFNAEGVTVWGKTGTAQAPPLPIHLDDEGKPDQFLRDLDHAWLVGLVGTDEPGRARPQYAISVIVEYGGSGGRVAGPIANQIIHALKTEGYLERSFRDVSFNETGMISGPS